MADEVEKCPRAPQEATGDQPQCHLLPLCKAEEGQDTRLQLPQLLPSPPMAWPCVQEMPRMSAELDSDLTAPPAGFLQPLELVDRLPQLLSLRSASSYSLHHTLKIKIATRKKRPSGNYLEIQKT